mgnify:CR=1 FL=1
MEGKEGSIESKELKLKAEELAKQTRQRGMGMLEGKLPGNLSFSYTGHFIQGEYPKDPPVNLIRSRQSEFLNSDLTLEVKPNKQFWIIRPYAPPMENKTVIETSEIRKKTLFGLRSVTITKENPVLKPTNTPLSYNGKHGNTDWVEYNYYMPVIHVDTRPGVYVSMGIAVPPDLAKQIDEEVAKNVYFPDAFLKALYPGYVGPNFQKHITRIPAKELKVIDNRPQLRTEVLHPYPHPIPY